MITDSQQTSSPDIEAYLAMQLLKDGDRHAAIDKCHEAISQYGPNRNLYLVKARAHLELEEYGFAQEALLSLLSLDPEHPAGWALLGEAYYQLGNMPKVDYCRNRLKQIFPTLTEPDEEEAVGQDPCDPANIPVGQDPRGLDDIPASGAEIRRHDEYPVGQEPRGLDDIPVSGQATCRQEGGDTASGIIVPEAQENPIGQDPRGLDGIPASGAETRRHDEADDRAGEDACRAHTPTGGIVDDLIETDLRINEQAEGTAKIDVEIFETATFADICLAQGKYEKALDIYTKLLMVHPDNAEYREKINSIQAKMGSR